MILNHSATELGPSKVLITLHKSKRRMVFDCSFDEYKKALLSYHQTGLIQEAFPFLTDNQREFLLSGLYPHEFDIFIPDMYNVE